MIEGLFQPTHLIIIMVMVLIIFGPGKLPEIGGALGKGIREFKQSTVDAPSAIDADSRGASPAKGAAEVEASSAADV